MTDALFSDVQITNLILLLTVRDAALQDAADTCCRFGLDADQARRLTQLPVHQLVAVIANIGDTALFLPRRDLVRLLDTPLPLTRPFAAAQARAA